MLIKFTQLFQNFRIDDVADIKEKIAEKIIDAGYGAEVTLESTAIDTKKK